MVHAGQAASPQEMLKCLESLKEILPFLPRCFQRIIKQSRTTSVQNQKSPALFPRKSWLVFAVTVSDDPFRLLYLISGSIFVSLPWLEPKPSKILIDVRLSAPGAQTQQGFKWSTANAINWGDKDRNWKKLDGFWNSFSEVHVAERGKPFYFFLSLFFFVRKHLMCIWFK